MFDQSAELAENRKLDEIINLLKNEDSDDEDNVSEDSEEDRDYQTAYESSDEELPDIAIPHSVLPWQPSVIPETTAEIPPNVGSLTSLSALMPHLSYEEFDLITGCKDPALKELLVLNRVKHIQLKQLIKKYHVLQNDCERSLHLYWMERQKNELMVKKSHKLGYPYFRLDDYPPPNNLDFYRKKEQKEVNFAYSAYRMKWTLLKLKKLKTCVMFNYFSGRLEHLKDQFTAKTHEMQSLKNRIRGEEEDESNQEKVKQLQEEIDTLDYLIDDWKSNFHDLQPPDLWDDSYISWQTIAEKDFKDISLLSSLRCVWNNYVHPCLNKESVSDTELNRVQELLQSGESMDWKSIALALNTNRSEHFLCSMYMTHLNSNSDVNQDPMVPIPNREMMFIEQNRVKPAWNQMSSMSHGKFTRHLYNRYKYLKDTEHCKLGRFTLDEDMQIMTLVGKFGTNWDKIAARIPSRTKLQLRQRYEQNLMRENLLYGNWSFREDEQIYRYVREHGEANWMLLANEMNRNMGQIRHRYQVIKKHMAKAAAAAGDDGFDADDIVSALKSVPRRNHTLAHVHSHQKKLQAISNAISNGADEVRPAAACGRMRTIIDEQLVQFFAPTAQLKKARNMKAIYDHQMVACANTIALVLKLFDAKLEIPACLDGFPELDRIDRPLLELLRGGELREPPPISSDTLMPPNVSSTQVMRCLLMQSLCSQSTTNKISLPLITNTDRNQETVKKFAERFKTFLKWPALMSTVEPPKRINEMQAVTVVSKSERRETKTVPREKLKPQTVTSKQKFVFESGKLKDVTIQKIPPAPTLNIPQLRIVDPETVKKLRESGKLVKVRPVQFSALSSSSSSVIPIPGPSKTGQTSKSGPRMLAKKNIKDNGIISLIKGDKTIISHDHKSIILKRKEVNKDKETTTNEALIKHNSTQNTFVKNDLLAKDRISTNSDKQAKSTSTIEKSLPKRPKRRKIVPAPLLEFQVNKSDTTKQYVRKPK